MRRVDDLSDKADEHHSSSRIRVSRADVVWNYIGTVASMGGNFLLIPLLLVFLSTEQVGLWYVFVAISGLSQLLEFGFTATLSRNILYCVSGAGRLSKQGCDHSVVKSETDWHMLRVVLRTSKILYGVMGAIALVVSSTAGSLYVASVTGGFAVEGSLVSWGVFVTSVFTNLYFLYCLTFLRGVGDVAGENKAKTIARVSQLAITTVLLFAGLGLLAAAIGFFAYGLLLRLSARRAFVSHADIQRGLHSDSEAVSRGEMRNVLSTISFVAWRDGVGSLAWYGATQATSLISSAYLGLEQTATYSVMLQFATAIYNLSSTYMRSCLPMFQSACVHDDVGTQRAVLERGIASYIALFAFGTLLAVLLLPVLSLFKESFVCDRLLFLAVAAYYFLLNQHSLFCCLIVSLNEIPYFKAYLASACCGIVLSCVLCGWLHLGAWGLVLGQAVPQLLYNNWHWPRYMLRRVGVSYHGAIGSGFAWWAGKIAKALRR